MEPEEGAELAGCAALVVLLDLVSRVTTSWPSSCLSVAALVEDGDEHDPVFCSSSSTSIAKTVDSLVGSVDSSLSAEAA